MAIKTPPKGAASRRALPAARSANPDYEIVFKKAPAPGAIARDLYEAVGGGLSWAAETLGLVYSAAARSVLDRKEAIEDLNAERRFHARSRSLPSPRPDDGDLSHPRSS